MPRPRNSCSVSMWSTARTSTRRSMSRASSARPTPAARTKFAPWVCSIQGVLRRDRHRLDRCRPDLGASPGGRRAVALLPQSRHRRGSIPERVLARAEELAAKRPAARSRGMADHGRAQCRDRRYQAKPQAGAATRRRGDLRSRRRRGCAGRTARRLALSRRHFTDRKSTRLNSSHVEISYAVFCLKKKKKKKKKNMKHKEQKGLVRL